MLQRLDLQRLACDTACTVVQSALAVAASNERVVRAKVRRNERAAGNGLIMAVTRGFITLWHRIQQRQNLTGQLRSSARLLFATSVSLPKA